MHCGSIFKFWGQADQFDCKQWIDEANLKILRINIVYFGFFVVEWWKNARRKYSWQWRAEKGIQSKQLTEFPSFDKIEVSLKLKANSFKAYQKWVQKNGEELLLPGLNYSQNQLFFINNAQIWCSKYRDQYLRYQIVSANHSPGQFRFLIFIWKKKLLL